MSSEESDSDDTDPYVEEERYLEANEFMEHPDFGKDLLAGYSLSTKADSKRITKKN